MSYWKNCPWLLDLIKKLWRYWGLKRRIPFSNCWVLFECRWKNRKYSKSKLSIKDIFVVQFGISSFASIDYLVLLWLWNSFTFSKLYILAVYEVFLLLLTNSFSFLWKRPTMSEKLVSMQKINFSGGSIVRQSNWIYIWECFYWRRRAWLYQQQ